MSTSECSKKRTINSFFTSSQPAKRARTSPSRSITEVSKHTVTTNNVPEAASSHPSYPHPIASLPSDLLFILNSSPEAEATIINTQPDLDLIYYKPYIPKSIQNNLFTFLRDQLPFYRVKYNIKRGSVETTINTPRFTTVFGVDETSYFTPTTDPFHLNSTTNHKPIPPKTYKCAPRPLPSCLDALRRSTEVITGQQFNFCLINYYASGADSISYHSDDERFLGELPAIASFSLGAKRDFLMRHKEKEKYTDPKERDLKLELGSGDMVLMKGTTQSKWLHSIPKRKGGESGLGRINITFRRALVKGGTENYYRYNVGDGEVWRWDVAKGEMVVWKG